MPKVNTRRKKKNARKKVQRKKAARRPAPAPMPAPAARRMDLNPELAKFPLEDLLLEIQRRRLLCEAEQEAMRRMVMSNGGAMPAMLKDIARAAKPSSSKRKATKAASGTRSTAMKKAYALRKARSMTTPQHILRVLRKPMSVGDVTQQLFADGWTTTSNSPRGVVNAALAVMKRNGDITKDASGRYRKAVRLTTKS